MRIIKKVYFSFNVFFNKKHKIMGYSSLYENKSLPYRHRVEKTFRTFQKVVFSCDLFANFFELFDSGMAPEKITTLSLAWVGRPSMY